MNKSLPHLLLLYSFTLFSFAHTAAAEQYATDDNGRLILLTDDGSWTEVMRERFATTEDGQRVRLLPNGQWQLDARRAENGGRYNREKPTTAYRPEATSDPVSLAVVSADVLKKKTKSLKSTRLASRMRFLISLNNLSGRSLGLAVMDKSKISVSGKNGKNYNVLVAAFQQPKINAGESAQLEIVVEGSPFWLTRNPVDISLGAGALSNIGAKRLRVDAEKFNTLQVETF